MQRRLLGPHQNPSCTSSWCGGEHLNMGLLVEAMSSVMKASAEESPRALREVDRLNENSENDGQHRR